MTAKANVLRIIGHFPDNIHFTEDSRTKRSNCIEIVENDQRVLFFKVNLPILICCEKRLYTHNSCEGAGSIAQRAPLLGDNYPPWGPDQVN